MKYSQSKKHVILIAGSTASGKSAYALKSAFATKNQKHSEALIINADSMQVYSVLNLLSARPQADELAQVEHALYGTINPAIRFSTGAWLRAVEKIIELEKENQRTLIFVGGTGLYFSALIDGFTHVPPVNKDIVSALEEEIKLLSREQRLELLQKRDPLIAERMVEPDRQRLVRALSVLEASGKSLATWQDEGQAGLLSDFEVERIVLNPEREILNERIEQRFEMMMQGGAADEVKALLDMKLENNLPAMKAIGVQQIASWIKGDISKQEAIDLSVIATRQYAKRQRTWFRKRMKDWEWI